MTIDTASTASPPPAAVPAARPAVRPGALLALFAASVFTSAFLLFLVQPMFGKMVLPLLGGSPAVWNTCMLFFQAALLGGYLYAHLSTRWLSPRRQALLHLSALALAALALPVGLRGAAPEGGQAPIPWLLGVMLVTVGPPFLVLAGTGPMLQRWFSRTGHPDAAQPYHLYAASNLGSALALLAYPFLMEPALRLARQGAWWAAGYGLLALLVAGCAAAVWRGGAGAEREADHAGDGAEADRPPTARERAVWTALAFVPSSLLLGVTTFITTDLSPAPLLWVLPLAIYLLSFTLVFARRPLLPHVWLVVAAPSVLAVLVLTLAGGYLSKATYAVPLHLAGLFVVAMVAHGELARRRPSARHLTGFYLWIAVGGVLGGVFNALIAPAFFEDVWEYPIALVLACLARPWPAERTSPRGHLSLALRAAGFAVGLLYLVNGGDDLSPVVFIVAAVVLLQLLALGLGKAPLYLALCLGTVLGIHSWQAAHEEGVVLSERTFFGRYRVRADGSYRVLRHGSTLHGAQDRDRRGEPLTYYLRRGPLGQVFAATAGLEGRRRVAVVGLGTGTTAAYAAAGEEWTFYEIDPGIERIARDTTYFTYLSDSPARTRVVLGDARLSLARDEGRQYDLILLDAFSSDAIPVHLVTREALDVYLSRLAPGGLIGFHVSNRYLDLEPVVAGLARERGLVARTADGPADERGSFESTANWVILARRVEDMGPLDADSRWWEARVREDLRPWTDDHSSILDVYGW